MKKVFMISCMLLFASFTQFANAGTAFIPAYNVSADLIRTDIWVSNISNSVQTVTITLYNQNGSPLVSQPYCYRISGSDFVTSATDSNGQMVFSLPASNSVGISLLPSSDGAVHDGYGKITGTSDGTVHDGFRKMPAKPNFGLVAHAFMTNTPAYNTLVQNSISINGGNPF